MKISVQKGKPLISKNIGIFATSLLVTATATYIYSPVIGTNADTTADVDVNASVNPVASLSVDNPSLNFNIVPTASGYFDSKTVTATVDTNSTGGYELYFSSEDNNTAMTHSDSNISNTIASDFSGTVTSSTMAANKWGYSLDNTNFSKIPAANEQATIKNIDHYPSSAEKTNTVRIGMKLDTTLPSGTYSKNIKFSVLAHETPVPATIGSILSMQQMTPEVCSNSSLNESNTLTDSRDGNTYTVKKLKDGNCWMTENLRVINKTITPADSDISSDFTIPMSPASSFSSSNDNHAFVDGVYGGIYTFYTATAGWGDSNKTTGNSQSSICPKGWRLPTGGPGGEFEVLYSYYNSPALMQGDPGFTLSGYINSTIGYSGDGTQGYYWSSSVYDANQAYYMYMYTTTSVYPASKYQKYHGFAVHCIAR